MKLARAILMLILAIAALDQYHSLVRLIHRTAGFRRNYHYQRRAIELLNEIETGKIEFSYYGSYTG